MKLYYAITPRFIAFFKESVQKDREQRTTLALARALGIPSSTFYKILQGETKCVSPGTWHRFTEWLGVDALRPYEKKIPYTDTRARPKKSSREKAIMAETSVDRLPRFKRLGISAQEFVDVTKFPWGERTVRNILRNPARVMARTVAVFDESLTRLEAVRAATAEESAQVKVHTPAANKQTKKPKSETPHEDMSVLRVKVSELLLANLQKQEALLQELRASVGA
jgi:hypothetical protein